MCAAASMSLPVVQDGPGEGPCDGTCGVVDVVRGVPGVVRNVYKMKLLSFQ